MCHFAYGAVSSPVLTMNPCISESYGNRSEMFKKAAKQGHPRHRDGGWVHWEIWMSFFTPSSRIRGQPQWEGESIFSSA